MNMTDTITTEDRDLTKKEKEVKEVFDLMLDEGIDKTTAARYSVTAMPRAKPEFVEWLSEGTLTKVKGQVVENSTTEDESDDDGADGADGADEGESTGDDGADGEESTDDGADGADGADGGDDDADGSNG